MMRLMKSLMWFNVILAIYNFSAMSFLPPHDPLSAIHLVQLSIIPFNWLAAFAMSKTIKMKENHDRYIRSFS